MGVSINELTKVVFLSYIYPLSNEPLDTPKLIVLNT